MTDVKEAVRARLAEARSSLVDLSHRIHAHPELGNEEEEASAWLEEALDAVGFRVDAGVCGLPTAFRASYGSGPLHVALCAEYDALPGIGHACGHNIIAASSLGAGLALAAIADEVGLTVSVVGTPAEETTGGKIFLLERGGFAGVHAALMVHPTPVDLAEPSVMALTNFEVRYTGKAAHAAAAPHLGVNALDALTVAQTSIGLLRQHLRSTDRVHGVIKKGGDAFNVIPAETSAEYAVRAKTLTELADVYDKVRRCFEAGALATGAKLEILGGERPYAHMEHDHELAALYQANAQAVGRAFAGPSAAPDFPISTDMGNISLALPSIHPLIGIDSLPAVNHQPEFAAHCITEAADQALYDGALALAWTAIDAAAMPSVRERLIARTT